MAADKGCVDDLLCSGVSLKKAIDGVGTILKMQEMSWLNILMWLRIVQIINKLWIVGLLLGIIILMEVG
ncbi:MAG: hypothetical protein MZV64_27730 [Ignavibacteriales bacterium]|nr:hypothetical protein [Ignavibacteriales bacterium]